MVHPIISACLKPSSLFQASGQVRGSCLPPIKDSLVSMASMSIHLGTKIVVFFAGVCFKSAKWIFFSSQKKEATIDFDLSIPEQFLKAFKKSPSEVISKVISLLGSNPDLAKTVLMNLAKDWKKNPGRYLQYNKTKVKDWKEGGKGRTMRLQMVGALDELLRKCILSPELMDLEKKITKGDLTNKECTVMSMQEKEWNQYKSKTEELKKFRQSYEDYLNEKEKVSILWDNIYACFLGHSDLSDLLLETSEEHLDPKDTKTITFGHFMERMLYVRHPNSLRSDSIFEESQELILNTFNNLKESNGARKSLLQEFPSIEALVEQVTLLLSDKEKAQKVRQVLLAVLDEIDPLTKSPPRRT